MLFGKNVCYVGIGVDSKENIKGSTLDSFYIQEELKLVTNLKIINIINRDKSDIKSLTSSDLIWVDYPIARSASFLVLFTIFIFRKKLILRVRDLPVEQRRDLCKKDRSVIVNFQLKLIEKIFIWKAEVIVLSVPGFISYIKPRTSNIIIFPTGVCQNNLVKKTYSKKKPTKRILAYAGSLDRDGMIEQLSSMFSKINGWEFWIAGKGEESVDKNDNTRYFGFLSYLDVQKLYEEADAIIIPYPNKEYYKICIPLKIGEVLATCKPVITLKLPSIEKYLKYIDLENNVIYVDEWSEHELEKALIKAKSLTINIDETIHKLKKINWEDRVKKLMNEIDGKSTDHLRSIEFQLQWV
jgi:hypothetical protein